MAINLALNVSSIDFSTFSVIIFVSITAYFDFLLSQAICLNSPRSGPSEHLRLKLPWRSPLKLKTVTPWAPVGAKIKYVLLCSVAQWRDIACHWHRRLWRPGGDKLVLLETDTRRDGEVNIVHVMVHGDEGNKGGGIQTLF